MKISKTRFGKSQMRLRLSEQHCRRWGFYVSRSLTVKGRPVGAALLFFLAGEGLGMRG